MSVATGRAALVRRPGSVGRGGLVLLIMTAPLFAAVPFVAPLDAALQVGVPAAAGASCLVAGTRRALGRRTPWLLVGVAQLCNALGNVAMTMLGTAWRIDEVVGAGGQLLFLAATGLELLAVVQLARPRDVRRLGRALVEGLLVSAVLFTVAWAYGLGARMSEPGVNDGVVALGLVELAWDLVAVGVLAGVWTGRVHDAPVQDDPALGGSPSGRVLAPSVPVLLTAGLACAVLADVLYVAVDLFAGPQAVVPAWTLSLLWLLSSATIGLSPWWGPLLSAAGGGPRPSRSGVGLAVCVLGVLAVVVAGPTVVDHGVLVGSGAAVVLILILLGGAAVDNRRLTSRLADSERHFRTLVTDSHDVLARLDQTGRFLYVSPSVTTVLGHATFELIGRRLRDLVHDDDAAGVDALLAATPAGRAVELRMAARDGRWVWTEAVLSLGADGCAVLGVRDVDERVRLAAELERHAVTDLLTGLPNRWALERELAVATARHDAGGPGVGLLYCDLHGFKDVNDASGHAVGDRVLAVAAGRLAQVASGRGLLARFGGDEFAVLVTDGADVARLVGLARDLVTSMESAFETDADVHHLGMNVGVAVHEAGRPASELVRNADVAMYRAKAAGWGAVEVFTKRMRDEVLDRVRTRGQLRSAVGSATPELRFQPQVRLSDGVVAGAEALVGWRSPDGQMLATDAVIELAEDSGAIVDLGTRVLGAAAQQAAAWREAGHNLRMSVNLSVRQLAWPGMVDALELALAESGLPAGALTLEVTETLLVSGSPDALQTMERLRATGVRLAVDDFGTGYSGLSYLRQLTVDELKVDRSFLQGAGHRARATALLGGIVRLGHDLGLDVVGEGVESLAQARLLRRLGCRYGQGYAFSPSLSAAELVEFLAAGPFDLDGDGGWAGSAATHVPRLRPWPTPAPDGVSAS